MLTVRKSEERGHFNHGWLDTYHTFSFGGYRDRAHMNFRSLRVINEDRVAPGAGFAPHPHENMEILTYILDGALRHEDSTGHQSVISPGMLQRMSAGSGIVHSERNASTTEPVHLLQIWILPQEDGLPPSYEERAFEPEQFRNRFLKVAGPGGGNGALSIHQDVSLYATRLDPGARIEYAFEPGRYGWIQVAGGQVRVGPVELVSGDGLAITSEESVRIDAVENSELLFFDLA